MLDLFEKIDDEKKKRIEEEALPPLRMIVRETRSESYIREKVQVRVQHR